MKKTTKPIVVIVVAIALAASAAMILSREDTASPQNQVAASAPQSTALNTGSGVPPLDYNFLPRSFPGGQGGRVLGPANAPVTLVEFGDYQCPSCGGYHPIVKELLRREGDKLKLEFHHFPLVQIHAHALAASKAAEAAGDQGRYWEMNDMLFVNQTRWSAMPNPEMEFVSYATSLGLDSARFLQSFRSAEVEARILQDVERGRVAQIDATPTFFVNGERLQDLPQSVEDFQRIVASKLPAAK